MVLYRTDPKADNPFLFLKKLANDIKKIENSSHFFTRLYSEEASPKQGR